MFDRLIDIHTRPPLWGAYTAAELWTNEHTSRKMLEFHLNEQIDVSSRRHEFIDHSVEWMTRRFGLAKRKSVADFGCGPGLYAQRLARMRASVTGIDFSPRSIEYASAEARKENLQIEYVNADYLEYEPIRRFDLIVMIMCDFCALSPEQRSRMLKKFKGALKPGGNLLFDVYSLNAFREKKEEVAFARKMLDGFWSPEDYFAFISSFRYEEAKVVLDRYTIIEKERTREVFNWLQHFSPETLGSELAEAGFVVDELIGDVAGGEYDPKASEFAVIASLK